MKRAAVTGIGRGLDLRIGSNRVAVAGTGVAVFVMVTVGWYRDDLSILAALLAGVAVFIAWATARELTPDYPGAATAAMVLALGAAVIGQPSVLISAVAMIGIRLVAGTVGVPISVLDVAILGVIGAASGVSLVLWIVAVPIGAWVWSAPEVGSLRRTAKVAFVVGVLSGLALAYALAREYGWPDVEITGTAYVFTAVAGAAMLVAARPTTVTSMTDSGAARIDVARIRFARLAAGSFVMWAAVMGGIAGFWSIAPVMAALLTTAIYRVFREPA